MSLFAVAGVSGNTGAAVAEALLSIGHGVRVIVRDAAKGASWAMRGAEVAVADLTDAPALIQALRGADGAFVLSPSRYDIPNPIEAASDLGHVLAAASKAAKLPLTVVLSSIAAQHTAGTGMIKTNNRVEAAFKAAGANATFLRAPYFLENLLPVLSVIQEQGLLPSLIDPDQRMDMIPVRDIGASVADLLTGMAAPAPVVELHSVKPVTMREVGAAFADRLGKPVHVLALPVAGWADAVAEWGMHPAIQAEFVEMYKAIADGIVDWDGHQALYGRTTLADWAGLILDR
ncbi:NmrA family NAD(P)-binding protein [Niveispirillum cyanobacteriorum]|nr:NmrA family NAD(P)-binding protein [Niveispirillum cyanobacteriorum]GGE63653.1 NmrA family protein [Niveispirillum cyanobacteriorum]